MTAPDVRDDLPLAGAYDVALIDLDGVVYSGDAAVPGAVEALEAAERLGMGRVFVTNNASRTPAMVVRHLVELGVPAQPDDVVTSAQAAATLLAGRLEPGARVLVVGGEGLVEALHERGLRPVSSADDEPAAVVQGFSPTLSWQLLMEACVSVRRKVPWIATNTDATLPTPRGEGPGNGALVDVVRRVTGRDPDEVAGKPFVPIMDEARRRRPARRPLVVGDRLDTDIEAANAASMDSLLVLTGVTGVDALLRCPPRLRPSYVAPDLSGLLASGRRVEHRAGWWRCGQAAARLTDSGPAGRPCVETRLEPAVGSANDAATLVHAVAAVTWAHRDDGSGDGSAEHAAAMDALSSWAARFGWDR